MRTPHFHLAPLALAAALSIGAIGTTHAQQTPAMTVSLAAQPLGQALNELARQAGLQLSFPAALVAGRTAPAVFGRLTVAQALDRLLAGSDLVASVQGSEVVVRRAPAAAAQGAVMLPTITVTGNATGITKTEGTGSYTTDTITTGTGMELSLRDTPQSVTVFTRQKMDDLGIQSVEDMALHTTGLTVSRGAPERAEFISRGFTITNLLLDGVPMALDSDFYGLTTLAMYDHAEVLRGAAGLTVGSGQPSGVISLTRKRPTKERKVSITASAGRWDDYRTEIDAGGPLNEAGTLRGRVVLAKQDAHTFVSHYSHDRELYYGTLEADLTPSTTLSIGASHNNEVNNGSAWYGLPTAEDGSFLPVSRSANYTPAWAYWNKRNQRFFADLEQRFDNGWKSKLSAYAMETDLQALLTSTSHIAGTRQLEVGWSGTSEYYQKHRGIQATADGPFELFGRKHHAILGATARSVQLDVGGKLTDYSFTYDQTDWQAVVAAPYPTYTGTWGTTIEKQQQGGVYGATRLNLSDRLKLIAGTRLDRYKASSDDTVLFLVKNKVVPYVGTVFDLNDTYSAYASWTRVFNPQDYRSATNSILAPLQGTNVEAGIKGEHFGGALTTSAAVFQSSLTNLPITLDPSRCQAGLRGCYAAAGKVESKGIELEAHGQVAPGWQLGAGFTYNNAHYVEDSDEAAAGTRYRPNQPRQLLKVSTSYRLSGAWNGVTLGASLRTQNRVFSQDGGATIRQGGYSVLDLQASWQVTRELLLQLNLNNLTDKHYYESLSGINGGNGWGVPRNMLVTARYQF